ncbi:MAG: PHP domain-containing protein [Candidatus Thorarchaeota archaeon]
MNKYSFDVHMHTHYSYDSLLTPRKLVQAAAKAGLSAIVVTDHNTTKGGFASVEVSKSSGLELSVFVGAEIKTEHGDVIGLFLNDEVQSRRYHEVIDEIRAQDGIVYLPHPFASYTSVNDMDLNRIQVIEAYNGRNKIQQNRRALVLGRKLGIPILGGSDAHLQYEVGTVKNLTNMDITQEDVLRKVVLDGTSSIRICNVKRPVLPRFMMTQYISWIRSHQSRRVLDRILLFLLRQTKQVSGLSP